MTAAVDRNPLGVGQRTSIRTILLATDLSPASDEATRQAIELCRLLQASLLVVNVIDSDEKVGDRATIGSQTTRIDQHRAQREPRLLEIVERGRASGVYSSFLLWTGEAGPGIVAAAEAEQAGMVVVGTHGRGRAGRFLLGSVSEYVVYNSEVPVLVAR
ncbi:MAG TPA: universal stress protein [Candidatus Limnocylindrales bacterium]|nr:universal stress protein [Candidatus Limnocylindrales bacterium]